jgi:gluconokinase
MICNTKNNIYRVESTPIISRGNDLTLHDPYEAYKQTLRLGKKLRMNEKIDVIALVTTWHSLILCDQDFNPLSPTYLWSNQIAAKQCEEIKRDKEFVHDFYNKTGCPISGSYPFFKLQCLSIKDDILIADQGSFNLYQLTDVFATSHAMASGSGFYNTHKGNYDLDLLAKLSLTLEQLPKIVSLEESFPLNKISADILGVEPGIPVLGALPDGAANQFGASALLSEKESFGDKTIAKENIKPILTMSVGTSGALRIFSSKALLSKSQATWCYYMDTMWLIGTATSGAGNCVNLYKNKLFNAQVRYEDIEVKLKDHKYPNSLKNQGFFMPFIYGERSPGWNNNRYGGFLDIEGLDSVESYIRVLEGVLFNLYQSYLEMEKLLALPKEIHISGGIVESEYWLHMCADIFGVTLVLDEFPHSSLYGGVRLAAASQGQVIIDKGKARRKIIPDREGHEASLKRFDSYLKYYHRWDV